MPPLQRPAPAGAAVPAPLAATPGRLAGLAGGRGAFFDVVPVLVALNGAGAMSRREMRRAGAAERLGATESRLGRCVGLLALRATWAVRP